MANFTQSQTSTNLATHTVIIPTTDVYGFQGTLTLPEIVPTVTQGAGGGAGTGSGGGPQVNSQVVVTIKKNGSTIYTTNAGDRGFMIKSLACAAGDSITFQRSSALAQDQQMNSIRMTLAISEGGL